MPWQDESTCSVFETVRVSRGRPVALDAHWQRLIRSQKSLLRKLPSRTLESSVRESAARLREGGLRVEVMTSGQNTVETILPRKILPGSYFEKGVSAVTAVGPGTASMSQWPQIKHGNRLNGAMAWGQLYSKGIFEQIWCNAQGVVCEGTFSNIFIWRKGTLMTAPASAGVLPGIVREAVFELARRLKIPTREQCFTRHELFTASEAFLTNSLIGIVAVREVDGRKIGTTCPGKITKRIQRKVHS